MNFFSGFFQRNISRGSNNAQHFLRVTTPFVDDLFQISKADANRAIEAQSMCTFFQFKTIAGRRCAIKLRLIQAIQLFEAPGEITSSNQICGVWVYLEGREEVLDIEPSCPEQVSEFFNSLEVGAMSATLGDWHFNTAEIVAAVASEEIK